MFDEAPAKAEEGGAPAWVMTFADLMSLLMCFFVLLLSFSEMDVSKYKEMAGSMKDAFGVQREIKVKEPPKGINVIAREFSPGRPEPTTMNVIRQMTTQDMNVNLDLGKERRRPVSAPKGKRIPDKEKTAKLNDKGKDKHLAQVEGLSEGQKKELAKAKALAAVRLKDKLKIEGQLSGMQGKQKNTAMLDNKKLEERVKAKAEAERRRKLEHSARLISNALGREIKEGNIDVETAGKKIIIRVREKASFGSGRADLKGSFRPILAKIAKILKDSEGKIVIAGHTDNIPINTKRFRSNWELSSARAVSVAHEMMLATKIPSSRFLVEGFADTQPMAPNDTPANRARNRRVEIILQQGDDKTGKTIGVLNEQGTASGKTPSFRRMPESSASKPPGSALRRDNGKGIKRVSRSAAKPAKAAPKASAVVKGIRTGGAKQSSPAKERKKSSTPSSGLGIKLGGSK